MPDYYYDTIRGHMAWLSGDGWIPIGPVLSELVETPLQTQYRCFVEPQRLVCINTDEGNRVRAMIDAAKARLG